MRTQLQAWVDDARYALRVLRRDRGFATVAIGSLALAFALVTVTAALLNAYLIRSLPYPHIERLYKVDYSEPGQSEPRGLSALDWSEFASFVEHVDSSAFSRMYIGAGVERDELSGLLVADGSVELLGVGAVVGRSIRPADFEGEAEAVALIGYHVWQGGFAGDTGVIGRTLVASRASTGATQTVRVIGVLPPDFRFARAHGNGALDFVMPMREPFRAYMVLLRAGVPPSYAEQVIDAAVRRIGSSFPPGWNGVRLQSVRAAYVEPVVPVLRGIAGACLIVLLVTCVNLAVLMMLRGLRRRREWATRAALGAGRGRLVRLQILESAMVCGMAVVMALAASEAALRRLAPVLQERLGRDAPGGTRAIGIDPNVLLAAAGTGLLVVVVLGLLPLVASSHSTPADVLRGGGNAAEGRASRHTRALLLAAQVAACVALTVGGGLMVRTVVTLVRTDLGYRTEQVQRARIALPRDLYADMEARGAFYDRLTVRLTEQPLPFALTTIFPFYEAPQEAVESEGPGHGVFDASFAAVSDGYFDLFGIRLLRGRGFTQWDRLRTEPVAIVSETFAQKLAAGGMAVGRRVRIRTDDDREVWRTIVGVVSDVRQTHRDADLDDVYIPFAQAPAEYAPLYMRTSETRITWERRLREYVAEIEPFALVTAADAPLHVQERRQTAGPRFMMALLSAFALVAAFLTALGIYGATAYAIQQRRRELAIRTALGATGGRIQRLFLRDTLRILAVGTAAGVFGAVGAGRVLSSQLYGVQPIDAATLLVSCMVIALVALLATWLPTLSAAEAHPMTVLRAGE